MACGRTACLKGGGSRIDMCLANAAAAAASFRAMDCCLVLTKTTRELVSAFSSHLQRRLRRLEASACTGNRQQNTLTTRVTSAVLVPGSLSRILIVHLLCGVDTLRLCFVCFWAWAWKDCINFRQRCVLPPCSEASTQTVSAPGLAKALGRSEELRKVTCWGWRAQCTWNIFHSSLQWLPVPERRNLIRGPAQTPSCEGDKSWRIQRVTRTRHLQAWRSRLQSAEKHANQACPWFEALHLDSGRTTANVGSSLRLFCSLQAARSFLRLQVRLGGSSPCYGQAPSLDKWRPESLSMWAECSGSTLVFDDIEKSGVWPEALLTGHVGLI